LKGEDPRHRNPESTAVLVVGTTPDYVSRLHKDSSEPLVFLTHVRFRDDSRLKEVPTSSLVFARLDAFDETLCSLSALLDQTAISGVACFDCESLLLAGRLAHQMDLPFPSWQAIVRSRNKFEARRTWSATGIGSPYASLCADLKETLLFFHHHGENIVLKPLSASGSELLFHCSREDEVRAAVETMEEELPKRRTNPLFSPFPDPVHGHEIDPCRSWIAEEFAAGEEFSCDFVYQADEVVLIRETGKVKATDKPFGSVLAYTFPPLYPDGFRKERLLEILKKAVRSLGFDRGFFMVDYVIRGGLPILIELTPRPGGDSIPDLVKIGAGRDILGLYLQFVTGRFKAPPAISLRPQSYASINLYAPKEGTIVKLDGQRIAKLPHVRFLFFKKKEGDRIILPPRDYDNRLLGHCIVAAEPGTDLIKECRRLEDLLVVSITPFSNPSPGGRG
jgi:biotin carboxylase